MLIQLPAGTDVTGFFEVEVVGGKLLHSRKGGDGHVDSQKKFQVRLSIPCSLLLPASRTSALIARLTRRLHLLCAENHGRHRSGDEAPNCPPLSAFCSPRLEPQIATGEDRKQWRRGGDEESGSEVKTAVDATT
eukprot:SAG11_NODE_4747_length_1781_cov_106.263830_1_plen_134_part_10